MAGFLKLTQTEIKLHLRDGSIYLTLLIPLFVLVIFGLSGDGGDAALPASVVSIAVALKALYELPTTLGTYRERGILRRLSTTPLRPATLLATQLAIQSLLLLITVTLLAVIASAALGLVAPRHLPWTLAIFALGTVAMFAIGLVVAALTPNARLATGIGVLLYFPLAFLGGVTIPRAMMPPILARVGEFTPLGAFRQALQDAWSGATPQPLHLAVLVTYAALVSLVAARSFRWE